ncbi:type I restriction enzyme HsdR N-terminal domain-containing protein [Flavobacterium sp. DSR3-2]|uniref:type I restriction enzyme HsdR N-terminal domain-containing protein n=1 Tax=Flavobacterium sp. DSR3-2 TaxID=2804634 RepID=UPI003CF4259A
MNNEKWSEICFLLSDSVKPDISENAFEKNIIQALRVLNWKQFLNDFDIRPSFQVGASNRITPDFVIKSVDQNKLFVIEIKQPNIPLNSNFQQQLFSYMRYLKLEYGILIGQSIQIFYDGDLVKQEDPILLETIKFEHNNERGIAFVELFDKENFDKEALKDFTLKSLSKINLKQDFKELTNKIVSDDFIERLNELIKQDFISEYDGELIDSVLAELRIAIFEKNLININSNSLNKQHSNLELLNSSRTLENIYDKDYTKYFFKGQTLGKNRLVLAVIKNYIDKNPNTTFSQLKSRFPDSLQGQETFTTENAAKLKKSRRNFIKSNELIPLADETIAVSTQWGVFNIKIFIEHCRQMNIDIKIAQ